MKNQQQIGINKDQFQKWLPQLNDNMMQQLVLQARQQGIQEKDIQDGLNFINKLRSGG